MRSFNEVSSSARHLSVFRTVSPAGWIRARLRLRITLGTLILGRMSRRRYTRSRTARCSLALAMLGWAMLGIGAFARPIAMRPVAPHAVGGIMMPSSKAISFSSMSMHCDGMPYQKTPSAPAHPGDGHGCCHDGGCHCSPSGNAIAGAPASLVACQPVYDSAIRPVHSKPGLTSPAPPLRPPIN